MESLLDEQSGNDKLIQTRDEEDQEILEMWEAIKYQPSVEDATIKRKIVIRVYVGSANNQQEQAFKTAWVELRNSIAQRVAPTNHYLVEPVFLYIEEVARKNISISEIINWLLESDVHFILGHIHQGLASHNIYVDMIKMKKELRRLYYHVGYPAAENLNCPVFTQDKKEYIKPLGNMANPTLIIYLNCEGGSVVVVPESVLQDVKRFCCIDYNEGIGYVVKAPFTTNCDYVKFCDNFDEVVVALENALFDLGGSIPYVMLQPKMHNRREHKVICYDGVPQYICSFSNSGTVKSKGGVNRTFKGPSPYTELFDFVVAAIKRVKEKCPALLCEGMFRVDVFQQRSGLLVVNEFESLEAGFPSLQLEQECQTRDFLRVHLSIKLFDCIQQLQL